MEKEFMSSIMKLDKDMLPTAITSLMSLTSRMEVNEWLLFLSICSNTNCHRNHTTATSCDCDCVLNFHACIWWMLKKGVSTVSCCQSKFHLCALVEWLIGMRQTRTLPKTKNGRCVALLEHQTWCHTRSFKFTWSVILH